MRRNISALVAVLTIVSLVAPNAALADRPQQARKDGGMEFPLNVVSTDQGSFTGVLTITHFAAHQGQLLAVGTVRGTLIDETGDITSIFRTVTLPVPVNPAAPVAAPRQGGDCEILHLELGPLDLDLLGLIIHLDQVVLDIRAEPGSGNLLGNLLCAIVNLLNQGGPLSRLADLLNRLLDIIA